MENTQDNFDFEPTVEAIRPWIDPNHPGFFNLDDEAPEFMQERENCSKALFKRLPEFFCEYLNRGAFEDVRVLSGQIPESSYRVIDPNYGETSTEQSRDEQIKNGQWRKSNFFPLTREEIDVSVEIIKEDKALCMTMALLGQAVVDYIAGFKAAMEYDENPEIIFATTRYSEVRNLQISFSYYELSKICEQIEDGKQFMYELLPTLTHGLGKDEGGGLVISEHEFASSLCQAFRLKAMRSFSRYGGDRVNHCPFGPVLGNISSVVLNQNDDGEIVMSNERRPGALFYFLYQMAEQMLDQPERDDLQIILT